MRLVDKSHVLREKGGRKSASGGDRVIKLVSAATEETVKRVGTSFMFVFKVTERRKVCVCFSFKNNRTGA